METWTFQRTFSVSKAFMDAHARQQLVLEGVDTVATLVLNGMEAAQMANAHRSVQQCSGMLPTMHRQPLTVGLPSCDREHRVDVKGTLVEGVNEIRIIIHSAVTDAAARAAAYPYPVPFVQAQPLLLFFLLPRFCSGYCVQQTCG